MPNETVIEGRKFRKLIDINGEKNWERFSGWTIISDQPFISTPLKSRKFQKEE